MRDFLSRFRFGDFAAYFLPGLVMLGAIVWALTLTVFGDTIESAIRGITFIEGLILACVAYTIGAFLSGSSNRMFPRIYKLSRRQEFRNARGSIIPPILVKPVIRVFQQVFGEEIDASTWSEDQFYMIRSVVNEKMPHASADAARQNDLMRLRENMVVPLLSLWFVALAFAFWKGLRDPNLGITVGAVATVAAYVAVGRLAGRASDNRAREVREICTAFVVGARLGIFAHPVTSTGADAETVARNEITLPRTLGKEILPVIAPTSGTA